MAVVFVVFILFIFTVPFVAKVVFAVESGNANLTFSVLLNLPIPRELLPKALSVDEEEGAVEVFSLVAASSGLAFTFSVLATTPGITMLFSLASDVASFGESDTR